MAQQRQPTSQLVFPNREMVTTGQLQNVLHVCGMAITGLMQTAPDDSDSNRPKNSEARIAMENTLIKACDRLEKILEDDRRWSIENQMELEGEFRKSHAENLKFLEAQRKASEELSTPHFQWKPVLMKSEDGHIWIALLGDPAKPLEGIMGMGRTPEEAMAEFDKEFRGKQKSPEVMAFLKQRVAEEKMYEQKAVDDRRNQNVGPTSGGEKTGPGNSTLVEPVSGLGPGIHGQQRPDDGEPVWTIEETETVSPGDPGTSGGSEKTRTSFVRKVAAFLHRLFRMDKTGSGK